MVGRRAASRVATHIKPAFADREIGPWIVLCLFLGRSQGRPAVGNLRLTAWSTWQSRSQERRRIWLHPLHSITPPRSFRASGKAGTVWPPCSIWGWGGGRPRRWRRRSKPITRVKNYLQCGRTKFGCRQQERASNLILQSDLTN